MESPPICSSCARRAQAHTALWCATCQRRVLGLPALDHTLYPVNLPIPLGVIGYLKPIFADSRHSELIQLWRKLFQTAAIGWYGSELRNGPRDYVDGTLDLEAQIFSRQSLASELDQFLTTSAKLREIGVFSLPCVGIDWDDPALRLVAHPLLVLVRPA